jgi:hypothetical protein
VRWNYRTERRWVERERRKKGGDTVERRWGTELSGDELRSEEREKEGEKGDEVEKLGGARVSWNLQESEIQKKVIRVIRI